MLVRVQTSCDGLRFEPEKVPWKIDRLVALCVKCTLPSWVMNMSASATGIPCFFGDRIFSTRESHLPENQNRKGPRLRVRYLPISFAVVPSVEVHHF